MNAILCLITLRPNKIWCEFLNVFSTYKIFMIVDDNTFELTDFINNYKNISFLQVDETKCKLNGYFDVSLCSGKLISGWDKALYYFNIEDKNYDFIWYMEDDVFVYNEATIIQIDNQYLNDDLVSKRFWENIDGNQKEWLWHRINIEYPPPYYAGMMCCVRFSKKMMNSVHDYACKHTRLFFLETLFPTIAKKNNLSFANPIELENIHYRHDFNIKNINMNSLYHPVKDMNKHISYRSYF